MLARGRSPRPKLLLVVAGLNVLTMGGVVFGIAGFYPAFYAMGVAELVCSGECNLQSDDDELVEQSRQQQHQLLLLASAGRGRALMEPSKMLSPSERHRMQPERRLIDTGCCTSQLIRFSGYEVIKCKIRRKFRVIAKNLFLIFLQLYGKFLN